MSFPKRNDKSGSVKKKKKKFKAPLVSLQQQQAISFPFQRIHQNETVTKNEKANADPVTNKSAELMQGNDVSHKRRIVEFVYPKSIQNGHHHQIKYILGRKSKAACNSTPDVQGIDMKVAGTKDATEIPDIANSKRKESLDDILYPNRKNHAIEKYVTPSGTTKPPQLAIQIKTGKIHATPKVKPLAQDDAPYRSKKDRNRSNSTDSTSFETRSLSGLSVEDAIKDRVGCRPRANSTDGELNLPQRGLCDERMVLAAHKWGSSWVAASPRGFANLGNTCFLNATLQCLVYLPTFCQALATMKFPSKQNSSPGHKFASILRSLVREAHGIETSSHGQGAIAPRNMVNAMPMLGQIGSKKGYKFRPGRQEDAHEFLIHLIDALQDGELKAAGIDQNARGWRDSLPIPRLDETTFIHRVFGGYLRSQVRCTKCNYRSNTYDPFLDLSLEVSKKSCNSILSAFFEFSRNERLDERNQWRCSGCKNYVCATKQLTVFRPPLSLCIQLKRFTYGGGAYGGFHKKMSFKSGGGGGKINKPIEFPAQLALPLSDGRKCEYNLTGIIVHVGGSSSSGHYTAYVKKPKSQNNQWYHMDDSFVEPVTEKTVLLQRDVYVLFYCRNEVKLELPTPPPRANMTAEQATAHGLARAKARADSISKEMETVTHVKSKFPMVDVLPTATVGTTSFDNAPMSVTVRPEERQTSMPSSGKLLKSSSRSSSDVSIDSEEVKLTPKPKDQHASPTQLDVVVASNKTLLSAADKLKANRLNKPLQSKTEEADSSSESSVESTDDEADENTEKPTAQKGGQASAMLGLSIATVAAFSNMETNSFAVESTGKQTSKATTPNSDSSSSSTSEDSSNDEKDQSVRVPSMLKDELPSAGSDRKSLDKDLNLAHMKGAGIFLNGEDSSSDEESLASSGVYDASKSGKTGGTINSKLSESMLPTRATDDTVNRNKAMESTSSRKSEAKTRVILDRGSAIGKLEVIMGPRFKSKKAWKPKVIIGGYKDDKRDLLGTVPVGQWDDDPNEVPNDPNEVPNEHVDRRKVVKKLDKVETDRKRKMHLDRWDSLLDQGKQKKVKTKTLETTNQLSKEPKFNPFSRLQSSIQKFNIGRAKGLFRSEQSGKAKVSAKGGNGRPGKPGKKHYKK